ncbi:hypothetical protein REM05_001050 [Salmonella enterica]|nr:hypothetical protein [Salmonella enterica]EIJ5383712.1 hypothetical protein [Salmonella enterica]EIK6197260.1 hypothetical protein [Salmonella enterica]EIN9748563.1 hypothetical protein [Salmonella enterica]EKA5093944.1 hypothetical protein [Salmonella enterica]
MSENNYGALMLRSALDISVDVTKITSPGIYPIIQGNINVPDASAGLLTVSLTPSKPQITFQKENSSVVYSFVNGNWEKPTATDVDALAKSQNGADIPNKPLFVQNLGLKETLNPTKRVSIGSVGTGAFDGSTPCINIGDSDSGFIGSADGVIDIYCNNAKVGYIDNAGLHMLAGIATNGNVVLQNDAREHIIIQNADGTPRMFIYKDKGGDGVHLNNGNDASTEYLFHKDGSFYAPFAVRAGGSKKLAVQANDNSTLSAMFNLWGDANRPTVIELDDDQGWHLYSQRNPDGSIVFTVNGDITANTLRAGGAIYQNNGDIFGSVWGNSWLSLWINNNFVADVQLGAGTSVTTWNNAGSWPNTPGYVVTSVWKDAQGENIDGINYAPLQKRVGNQWYTVQGGTV